MRPEHAWPSVSVVIPTYNRARALQRAIASVLCQTYLPSEIVVVDDGSTDDTRAVVNGFRHPLLRYVRHDVNRGGNVARNTGVEVARGELIGFLDSDDEWLPRMLEKQVPVLRDAEPSVGAVYGGYIVLDTRGVVTHRRIPRHRGFLIRQLLRSNVIGATATVLVKRQCLRWVGPFDPDLPSCQDWDMWIRLARYFKFDTVPEVLVRVHTGEQRRVTHDSRAVAEGHLRIARKYLEDSPEYAQWRKAEHLLAWGNRLVGFGHDVGSREHLAQGRRFLATGLRAQPWRLDFLLFYAASLHPLPFIALTESKSRLRRVLARLARRPAAGPGVDGDGDGIQVSVFRRIAVADSDNRSDHRFGGSE